MECGNFEYNGASVFTFPRESGRDVGKRVVSERTTNHIIQSNFSEVYLLSPTKINHLGIYSGDTKEGLLSPCGPSEVLTAWNKTESGPALEI